jgi:hypothetical protein
MTSSSLKGPRSLSPRRDKGTERFNSRCLANRSNDGHEGLFDIREVPSVPEKGQLRPKRNRARGSFPSDAATVFDSDPDSLWLQMIQKTELQLAKTVPPCKPTSDVKKTSRLML